MISIVVPIFNEEETLPALYARLTASVPLWKDDYEVLLVDDGSSDRSFHLMKQFADNNSRFHAVKLSRNFGHQAAVAAGMRYATGDAVIIMDGDLQDPPEEIPGLLEKWREGYDVVYAIRTNRKENWFKRTAYTSFYRLLGVMSDINIPLDSGDFCLMDRKVVTVLNHELPENIRFVRGLRAYAGFRQIGLRYERAERATGTTKYTLGKLVKLALDGIFGFTYLPLRLATYLGFLIAFPSFVIGLFFVLHRIFNFSVFGHYATETPGLATLAVGIYFLSGIMLMMIGILGEYVGRIYIEVKRRPPYIVEQIYQANEKDPLYLEHLKKRL
jgi:polyisoprenyl-phosphate glycosyltransferase